MFTKGLIILDDKTVVNDDRTLLLVAMLSNNVITILYSHLSLLVAN